MGKVKGRGDEHACRINYLFQAGQSVAKTAPELSQYYGQVLTVISEKTAPKKDFTMKRSMCKKCHSVLKVGENATYRLRKNKHKKGAPVVVIGCAMCGEKKRIPTDRSYQLKAERDGKILQNGAAISRYTSPPNGSNKNNGKNIAIPSTSTSATASCADKTDASKSPVTLDKNEMPSPQPPLESATKDNMQPEATVTSLEQSNS